MNSAEVVHKEAMANFSLHLGFGLESSLEQRRQSQEAKRAASELENKACLCLPLLFFLFFLSSSPLVIASRFTLSTHKKSLI